MINLDEIRARCERYRTREIDHVYIETYLVDVEGLLSGHADLTRKLAKCEHMLATYQNTIVPELRTRLAEVKAERDAAVKDLRRLSIESSCECNYCEYKRERPISHCANCRDGINWQWRGKKEDTDHA